MNKIDIEIPSDVFKAYDIRGKVPAQLNSDFARLLGMALARRAHAHNITKCVVGFDGRHSSPELAAALTEGLAAQGIEVWELGMVPTPLVYFAAFRHQIGAAVAITGSHNPPEYNGFKIMMDFKAIFGEQVCSLRDLMLDLETHSQDTPHGDVHRIDIIPEYLEYIKDDITLYRPVKIAVDCGNGVGGKVAGELFRKLGAEVDELFCEVDGDFPNHHPDPADPHNLEDLISHLQNSDCEVGLAFDGDADRLGVVTKSGQIIWPDRQLILFAKDVLTRQPGAPIIYDVKCTRHVALEVEKAGGKPLMWKTGHSLVKAKLAEIDAPLAGEMSGHIFFGERWFGFDDGIYSGARLLEILSRHDDPSAVLERLPQDLSTPELKLSVPEGQAHTLIARLQENGVFPTATELNKIDGVRAEYEDGFGLARASNTTPTIVLRFEARSEEALQRIQTEFRDNLFQLIPGVTLPF